ncbi:MAG: hypothetical protein A3J81_04855 [Nitrospirae bacterium RIFOXYB2_FULL_43_5]|nr:MAG: hypothetical protein A3G93_00815 [Nitrospinae bacterium RIFCSPLOWO2_12_FULL_45_22]OGW74275.1 MAG: hypothetical protein A3J81_04855 [Nitrospirae bacterium RIFOXYB2_FULL_43_5]
MKRLFALITLAFFLVFSANILTACKQKPKEEPAVEEGAGKAEEPQAVTPAPAEQPAPAPAEQPAPAPAPAPEQPQEQPQTPGQ